MKHTFESDKARAEFHKKRIRISRIFHPYTRWEDYRNGFYDTVAVKEKEEKIQKVLELFNNKEITEKMMRHVINHWKYSCENNLTNYSLNRVAWIGQAACCVYFRVPNTITMEAWNLLSKEVQERSNDIANMVIREWEEKNKSIQLCLNID